MTHFEIDFLPVGEKGKSADAIAMRFGDFGGSPDKQFVVVVDGGTQDSGKDLVAHIRNYYRTNVVDMAVLTHPDSDHASGLKVVLEEMSVGHLLMHKPWEHSSEIIDFIEDERVTTDSLRRRLRKSLQDARDLENAAHRKKIPILEPFAAEGLDLGPLQVLNPTRALYELLLAQFRNIGEPAEAGLFRAAFQAVAGVVSTVFESMDIETLTDPANDATSAENNTSVVLHYQYDDDYQCVLTGDAGVLALTCAAARAEALGINLQAANCIQVPHHGSRHNVGPTILDRIIGPKQAEFVQRKNAMVSASKGDDDHPSKKVTNAFFRRGAPVYSTQGACGYLRCGSPGTPNRPGSSLANHIGLCREFEED